MTNLVNVKMLHDATPTWSGYNHQGKVALLVALDIIEAESKMNFVDIEKYEMELEWMEDIAVKKGDKYVSIHQVKAYKSKNISNYGDAIWMLLGKCHEKDIPKSYLHTTLAIDIDLEDIRGITVKDSTAKYREKIFANKTFENLFSDFNSYIYSNDNKYCGLEEVDELIADKISKIIKEGNIVANTKKQINCAYLNLLDLIHKYVLKRHVKVQKGLIKQNDQNRTDIDCIPFTEILDVISVNYEESSEDYYCLELRKIFTIYADEFMLQLQEDEETINVIASFKSVIDYLSLLNEEDFLQFCRKISPHSYVQNLDSSTYHSLLPKDGVYDSFFSILTSISYELVKNASEISYVVDHKIYIPTAISSHQRQAERVAQGIMKNENMLDELFQVNTIISERMNIKSIGEAAQKYLEISPSELGENDTYKENHKITKIKKIRIVDKEKSKEELDI